MHFLAFMSLPTLQFQYSLNSLEDYLIALIYM